MQQIKGRICVNVAWWLRWYLFGVALMCRMTGCQPDMGRVMRWTMRAVTMRIERCE